MFLRFLFSTFLGVTLLYGATPCPPLSAEKKEALTAWAKRKFGFSTGSHLTLDSEEDTGACYRRLRFVEAGGTYFDAALYLTPDEKFLVPDRFDSEVDPVAEERERQRVRRRELEHQEAFASKGGPVHAPVVVVVFSDFECPYCRVLAETLDGLGSRMEGVRIVFRNMPLRRHKWARRAADAAACAGLQGSAVFWRVHDYLFANQEELTQHNVLDRVAGHLATVGSVDAGRFRECVERGESAGIVKRDLAVAARNKVDGTPTVYVNGRLAEGALTPEHLLTLIRESQIESEAAQAAIVR